MSAAATLVKPSVVLNRRYNAPPARVFAAWTEPQEIVRWFGASDARTDTIKAVTDVRTGGRFSFSFTHGSGELFEVSGVYKEVIPDEKLVFSWAWHSTPERESQITVLTRPDGTGTLLTLKHEQLFDQAAADNHKRGWTRMLENIATWLDR
jgi:uncharacterized protein YndB with AHSA1/START domain